MPRVHHAFLQGHADAWAAFGFKLAAEEIRLQLPRREFHGWHEAMRSEARRNEKKADGAASLAGEPPAERLTELLRALPVPAPPSAQATGDRLDRDTLWSGPSNLSDHDAPESVGGGIV